MRIFELLEILKNLNPNVEVFIDDGNMLSPMCGNYEVVKVAIGETIETSEILMLRPCQCNVEQEENQEIEAFNLN